MTKSDRVFEYALQNLVAMLRLCRDLGMGADVRGVMTAARMVEGGGTFDSASVAAKLGIPELDEAKPQRRGSGRSNCHDCT